MQIPKTPSQEALDARLNQIRAELNQSQVERWEEQHNTRRRSLSTKLPTTPSDSVYSDSQ